jgi:hypothetical protein
VISKMPLQAGWTQSGSAGYHLPRVDSALQHDAGVGKNGTSCRCLANAVPWTAISRRSLNLGPSTQYDKNTLAITA